MKSILIVLFLFNFLNIYCEEEEFNLNVSINGNYFFVGEPLVFAVTLCNEGNKTILIPKFLEPNNKNFKIEVKYEGKFGQPINEKDKKTILSASSVNKNKEWVALLPNKEIEIKIDISQLISMEGNYSLQITYQGNLKLIDDKKNISLTKKKEWPSHSFFFSVVEKDSKQYEEYKNLKVELKGKDIYVNDESILFTISIVNDGEKTISIPKYYEPFEKYFVITTRKLSNIEPTDLGNKWSNIAAAISFSDIEENWLLIPPKSKKDYSIYIYDHGNRLKPGEYETQITFFGPVKIIDENKNVTIPKKHVWESSKSTFKVVEILQRR